jgi:hypothetical protein
MTAESDTRFEFLISGRLSESRFDGVGLVLMIGRRRRESWFVWGRGCVGFCGFPGPSIKDGGLEVAFMSRKE